MRVAAVVIVVVSCHQARPPQKPPEKPPEKPAPDAATILAKSIEIYEHATSYVDHGTAITRFTGVTSTEANHTNEKSFVTAFERPRFRFEYREGIDPKKAYVIWSDGQDTMSNWYVRPGVQHVSSLSYAIAGATGVSSSTAHVVPRLLMPEIGGTSMLELTDGRVLATEPMEGHLCWKIAGMTKRSKDPMQVWIDTTSYLLRRTFSKHHFDVPGREQFDTESSVVFDPVINAPVAPDLLLPP